MSNLHKQRSEETKQAILSAAGKLFAERGFDSVSIREIAKEAGCSHTTIYIYFKDKEDLLHELSMPALSELKGRFKQISEQSERSPASKLKEMSMEFIRFCLLNKTMYTIFFIAKGTSVDAPAPRLAVNKLRIGLFDQISGALQACLPMEPEDDRLLPYSRIYFFMLHGIVSTYRDSAESLPDLMDRLHATFEEAFEILLTGFQVKLKEGRSQK